MYRELWTAHDRKSRALLPTGFVPGTVVKGLREGMFPVHKTRKLKPETMGVIRKLQKASGQIPEDDDEEEDEEE